MAKAGMIQPALQLIQTINSNFRQAEALNAIAPILAEKDQTEQALQVAQNIPNDSVKAIASANIAARSMASN